MDRMWALITGASSGIGYCYAEELASRGYPLVVVSNEEAALCKAADRLARQYGVEICPIPMDLATADAADRLYEACRERNIRIDVLVNNAGMYRFGETLDIDSGFTTKMLALHVLTPTRLCLLFGQDMRRQRHGYILNMSSVTAWLAYPGINVYGATKRYLRNFSRGLHTELRDYGVYVTAVCPGAVDTDLYNLNEKLRRRLVRSGIMLPPGKLARKAVRALFRGKAVLVPGLLNRLALPLIGLTPHGLIRRAARRSGILPLQS